MKKKCTATNKIPFLTGVRAIYAVPLNTTKRKSYYTVNERKKYLEMWVKEKKENKTPSHIFEKQHGIPEGRLFRWRRELAGYKRKR